MDGKTIIRQFFSLSCIAIFICSCVKKSNNPQCTENYNCIDPALHPYFLGYTQLETDSILCRKYVKSTSFATLLDMAYFPADSVFYQYRNVLFSYNLSEGFDYELIIPATSDTYRISNLVFKDTLNTVTGSCSGMGYNNYVCLNNFDSIYVTRNGILDTPVRLTMYTPGNGYLIELKK